MSIARKNEDGTFTLISQDEMEEAVHGLLAALDPFRQKTA